MDGSTERAKQVAGQYAAELVRDGMVVGLGTGSTANHFITSLATRVAGGLRIIGVPTSKLTANLAQRLGIPLADLASQPSPDIDIDGADEVDPGLNVLKGMGGALLHEKIVALAARRFIVVVDSTKLVDRLVAHRRLPIEVVAFGWTVTQRRISAAGGQVTVRGGTDQPYVTDSGNLILDVQLAPDRDVFSFASEMKSISGVVDHGLFPGMAAEAIVGHTDGVVRTMRAR